MFKAKQQMLNFFQGKSVHYLRSESPETLGLTLVFETSGLNRMYIMKGPLINNMSQGLRHASALLSHKIEINGIGAVGMGWRENLMHHDSDATAVQCKVMLVLCILCFLLVLYILLNLQYSRCQIVNLILYSCSSTLRV